MRQTLRSGTRTDLTTIQSLARIILCAVVGQTCCEWKITLTHRCNILLTIYSHEDVNLWYWGYTAFQFDSSLKLNLHIDVFENMCCLQCRVEFVNKLCSHSFNFIIDNCDNVWNMTRYILVMFIC